VNPRLKRWIADWVPPHLRRLLRGTTADNAVRYSGDFRTWDEARRHSLGYDGPAIVERVKEATLKVERGEAAYERDSVLFERVEHSYPLLAGGSLGSTFFQCRPLLEGAASLRWSVVEQPIFAACGRYFESEQLHFFDDLQSCLATESPDIALLSSVLPYVETPHALLETVAQAVPRVLIDRTPLWSTLPDRLTVQSVPASIYGFPTSYPAWILNRERLLDHFSRGFRIVFEFDALAGRIDVDGTPAKDTGFLLEHSLSSS
jgi:putative methyltransferase (TIGR04325 family)